MTKAPKDKHRMRRPQPANSKPGRRVQDIKKAYTEKQLIEIAAIALTWNQVDAQVDYLLLVALRLPPSLYLDITKRINGMDGKIQILRLRSEQAQILTKEAKACVKLSLDAVEEYKKYRDAIVHSITFDVDRGIAQRIGSRAEIHQILVTIDALSGLYQRLAILQDELQNVGLLYRVADEIDASIIYPAERDPFQARRTRDVPVAISLVQEYQNCRRSLPPLPEFPEELPSPREWMAQFAEPARLAIFPVLPLTTDQAIPPPSQPLPKPSGT